jgi:hypothetical protein
MQRLRVDMLVGSPERPAGLGNVALDSLLGVVLELKAVGQE